VFVVEMRRRINRTYIFSNQKTHPSQENPDTLSDNVITDIENTQQLRACQNLCYLAIISVLNQPVVHSRSGNFIGLVYFGHFDQISTFIWRRHGTRCCGFMPSPTPHQNQRLRSRLIMLLAGLNWFALKKCISLGSFLSTKVFILLTPSSLK
jgi:hypothetical protein